MKNFSYFSYQDIIFSCLFLNFWPLLLSLFCWFLLLFPFLQSVRESQASANEIFLLLYTHLHWMFPHSSTTLNISPMNELTIHISSHLFYIIIWIYNKHLKLLCIKLNSCFSLQSPLSKWSHKFFQKNYWYQFKFLSCSHKLYPIYHPISSVVHL